MEKSNVDSRRDWKDSEAKRNTVILSILKYAFLIVCCLMVILPLLVVLIGSLKTNDEYLTTNVFL